MKKIVRNTLAALLLTTGVAKSQDFFDGMPGPRGVQLDNYISIINGKISGMEIPKIFFENLNKNYLKIITAFPMVISNKGEINLKGISVGIHKPFYSNKNSSLSAILAMGLFKDNKNLLNNLSSQIYLTSTIKNFSIDFQETFNINLKNGKKNKNSAITVGYGNNRMRFGGSIKFQSGKNPQCGGIVRVDLKKNHQYWLEGYISKQRSGIRFAANF